jgi:hypothetical protein
MQCAGSTSHVRYECLVAMPPPLTHGNTTCAVIGVVRSRHCLASADHVDPGSVFGGSTSTFRFTMCSPSSDGELPPKASARTGAALCEMRLGNETRRAARTHGLQLVERQCGTPRFSQHAPTPESHAQTYTIIVRQVKD